MRAWRRRLLRVSSACGHALISNEISSVNDAVSCSLIRWPTVTAKELTSRRKEKPQGKKKNLRAKRKTSGQKEKPQGKKKNLRAKRKTSGQKEKPHAKRKRLTAKTKTSRQKEKGSRRKEYLNLDLTAKEIKELKCLLSIEEILP